MDDLFADKVSFHHEIDHNPKPEDAGRIKVYASILMSEDMSEDPIVDCPTLVDFSFPAKEILDIFPYSWEQLNCLRDDERLNNFQLSYGIEKFDNLVAGVIYSSLNYYPDCAFLFYITFTFIPSRMEEHIRYMESLERTAIFQEDMQVALDESTTGIRFRPARKAAVESLSKKVYKKTTSSSDLCTICFDEFKMGERVVTLPCSHQFDDRCILEWFANNHVCPLCRFELPCEN